MLKVVNLRWNNIGDEAATAFADALVHRRLINGRVDLADNLVSPESMQYLTDVPNRINTLVLREREMEARKQQQALVRAKVMHASQLASAAEAAHKSEEFDICVAKLTEAVGLHQQTATPVPPAWSRTLEDAKLAVRVQELEAKGQDLLSQRCYAAGIKVLQRAVQIRTPSERLLATLAQAHKSLEITQTIFNMISQAKKSRSVKSALQLVQKAAELDPTNKYVQRVQKQVADSGRFVLSERFPSGCGEWEEELVKWAQLSSTEQSAYLEQMLKISQSTPETDVEYDVDAGLVHSEATLLSLINAPAKSDSMTRAITRIESVIQARAELEPGLRSTKAAAELSLKELEKHDLGNCDEVCASVLKSTVCTPMDLYTSIDIADRLAKENKSTDALRQITQSLFDSAKEDRAAGRRRASIDTELKIEGELKKLLQSTQVQKTILVDGQGPLAESLSTLRSKTSADAVERLTALRKFHLDRIERWRVDVEVLRANRVQALQESEKRTAAFIAEKQKLEAFLREDKRNRDANFTELVDLLNLEGSRQLFFQGESAKMFSQQRVQAYEWEEREAMVRQYNARVALYKQVGELDDNALAAVDSMSRALELGRVGTEQLEKQREEQLATKRRVLLQEYVQRFDQVFELGTVKVHTFNKRIQRLDAQIEHSMEDMEYHSEMSELDAVERLSATLQRLEEERGKVLEKRQFEQDRLDEELKIAEPVYKELSIELPAAKVALKLQQIEKEHQAAMKRRTMKRRT
jgi:predicted Fe-S protein YdhL (DUF1289 family)